MDQAEYEDDEIKLKDYEIRLEDQEIKFEDQDIKLEDQEIELEDQEIKLEDQEIKLEDQEVDYEDKRNINLSKVMIDEVNCSKNDNIQKSSILAVHLNESSTSASDEKTFCSERWPPLGESASSSEIPVTVEPKNGHLERIISLENEKEQLSSSLFALTTRFAQVQFRLHQIHEAKEEDRSLLLEELNELANKGCVDQYIEIDEKNQLKENQVFSHQQKVISELKSQLEDLESFAFEQGAGALPQALQLQKQQTLLEQVASKLNLQLDETELATSSEDALRSKVDEAVAEIVNPGKVKAKLVDHLQTQIQDLERFVEFLQVEQEEDLSTKSTTPSQKPQNSSTILIIRRAIALFHMFSLSQLGCGAGDFHEASKESQRRRKSAKMLIGRLKHSVNRIRSLMMRKTSRIADGESNTSSTTSSCDSDVDDGVSPARVDDDVTQAVRRDLCPALCDIISDGLMQDAIGRSSVIMNPISCIFPRNSSRSAATDDGTMHAWGLMLEFYHSKKGALLARLPQRMLSRAFKLEDLVGCDGHDQHSARRSLLEAINQVISEHQPLKRSDEDMFKALVCLGLNSHRLSQWIRVISHSSLLISRHYGDDSYAACTGFDGVATVLSKLDSFNFHLPVDVAVRPFKNIRDAF